MNTAPATPPSLHDIALPEPVSLLPQTAGWFVVGGLLLLLLGWASVRAARQWRANRYRRLALAELDAIEQAVADPAARPRALTALPGLVKRTALACRPRSEVASLSGDPWLRLLDASYGGSGFTEGPGRLLPILAYRPPGEKADEIADLVQLIRHWIRHHSAASTRPGGSRVRV